jgi:hypothetical protein
MFVNGLHCSYLQVASEAIFILEDGSLRPWR